MLTSFHLRPGSIESCQSPQEGPHHEAAGTDGEEKVQEPRWVAGNAGLARLGLDKKAGGRVVVKGMYFVSLNIINHKKKMQLCSPARRDN